MIAAFRERREHDAATTSGRGREKAYGVSNQSRTTKPTDGVITYGCATEGVSSHSQGPAGVEEFAISSITEP